ncbi:MAG: polyprenyl synthetase family protein [Oligoflexia bacterium]|nr:polyprenyl synthetase family protein [Oligoflexia bacterium]
MNFMLEQFIPKHIIDAATTLKLEISLDQENIEIRDLLKRSMFIGGKRLRPLLMFMFSELYNIPLKTISPYALSAELIHLATLSHDDVVDNATTRRGMPSINILASNKRAVLVGDYLLAHTVFDLCKHDNIRILQELSVAIKDLALGEWLQLNLLQHSNLHDNLNDKKNLDIKPPHIDQIENIAKKKTASVISFCTTIPAILANISENLIDLSRSFGHAFGIAFQLSDDLLDFSSEDQTGKNSFNDLENGTLNSVIVDFFNLHPIYWQRWINNEFDFNSEIKKTEVNKFLQFSKDNIKKLIDIKKTTANKCLDQIVIELEKHQHRHYQQRQEQQQLFKIEIIESMKALSEYVQMRNH